MRTMRIGALLSSLIIFLVIILPDTSVGANQVGLFLEKDGSGPLGSSQVGVPFSVYLVLIQPETTVAGGGAVTAIQGYELAIEFHPVPAGDLFMTGWILPPNSIDIGLSKDVSTGYVDLIVGIADDLSLPVTDGRAVLAQLQFLALTDEVCSASLVPTRGRQSLEGQMCYLGNDISLILPMVPVSGTSETPVFRFNDLVLPVESRRFGSVKALFR